MSQRDMFVMSQLDAPNTQSTSVSLPPAREKKSSSEYHWLLTFHCNEDDEHPFNYYITSLFRGAVPRNWLIGKLQKEWGMQERLMPNLPGTSYKVFAKIQKGNEFY